MTPPAASSLNVGDAPTFREGYSVGKAKTHFELRNLDHDPAVGCGCEPCKTARIVRARP